MVSALEENQCNTVGRKEDLEEKLPFKSISRDSVGIISSFRWTRSGAVDAVDGELHFAGVQVGEADFGQVIG